MGSRWVCADEWRRIVVRLCEGGSPGVVAAEFGRSVATVERAGALAVLSRRRVRRSELRLSFAERERISRGIAAGESDSEIARALGRHRSTIGREIRACGERRFYRAASAERKAFRRASRPKATKFQRNPRLVDEVERGLRARWSPRQISARLRVEYPDDPEMRISHETIYRSLYVQSRGELRRQLAAQLRSGRRSRRRQGRVERRGRIVDMIPISERPPEVEDRAVPGHWEADLLLGAYGRSAVATLVERHTRYVLLARLSSGRSTEQVINALKQRVRALPSHLTLSLTCDQGREFAAHKRFTIETGIDVYFCDPHSPWQRGTGENTNGLLRQYLPKNSDLCAPSQLELDQIAAELNGRPRQTLGWMTPAEKITELLR